ncbi:MAG: nuclear transport factor 2 family protein [Dehalococcoidia bacterium]
MAQQSMQEARSIETVGDQWADAERRGDVAALAPLLADSFLGVGRRGFVLTKAQWLARYQSGDLKHDFFAWTDVTARVYGSTAVLIGRQATRGSHQGHPLQGVYRTTLVFIRQADAWLLASLQLRELPRA